MSLIVEPKNNKMKPITLKYCVTEIINVEKSQNINDINFICVEHTENGKRMCLLHNSNIQKKLV